MQCNSQTNAISVVMKIAYRMTHFPPFPPPYSEKNMIKVNSDWFNLGPHLCQLLFSKSKNSFNSSLKWDVQFNAGFLCSISLFLPTGTVNQD